MRTPSIARGDDNRPGWLAFHIRRLRQWFGSKEVSQTELAARAGVPLQRLRTLEAARELPRPVESLVRVAVTLGTTVDRLIDVRHVERVRRSIENGGDGTGVDCQPYCPTIALCYRSPYLAAAVLHDGEILEVQRTRVANKKDIGRSVARLITEYGCRKIVVEPDRQLLKHVGNLHCEVRTLAMSIAKRALLPPDSKATHAELYRRLLDRFPQLQRLVTVLVTGRIAMSEKWRVVQLLPVALGLAADRFKLGDSTKEPPQ